MKRFAAIVTIVVVVLAMSAGTAFASTCAGGTCTSAAMLSCADMGTASCPMGVTSMLHSACGHPMDRSSHDVVAPTQTVDHAVVASLGTVPAVSPTLVAAVPAAVGADARGAPHLTAVIRI